MKIKYLFLVISLWHFSLIFAGNINAHLKNGKPVNEGGVLLLNDTCIFKYNTPQSETEYNWIFKIDKADGSSYEANCATHGAPLGGDAYVNTIKNLGGDPTNPFVIFPEVKELYAKRAAELKEIMAKKYAAKSEWAKANPEKAAKLDLFFSGKAPEVNWAAIEQKA